MKKITFIFSLLVCFILSSTYVVNALEYYDLKFEKKSENIVKGEFEKINDDILITDNKEINLILDKKYKSIVDTDLNKDEEDAISYCLGSEWKEEIEINKEEEIKIEDNIDTYVMVRPVYKEITGVLVKDYISWEKRTEIKIMIPVDMEYTFENIQ